MLSSGVNISLYIKQLSANRCMVEFMSSAFWSVPVILHTTHTLLDSNFAASEGIISVDDIPQVGAVYKDSLLLSTYSSFPFAGTV